jgi:hypothetical protein
VVDSKPAGCRIVTLCFAWSFFAPGGYVLARPDPTRAYGTFFELAERTI